MHVAAKPQECLVEAQNCFHKNPNWVMFYREILGQHGIVRRLYPTKQELAEFEKTQQYVEIQAMLSKLRAESEEEDAQYETCKVITVRLPKSIHEALKVEADAYSTSMNQLCIAKLLQIVDGEFVPPVISPKASKEPKEHKEPTDSPAAGE